ncbi:MAG TPA: GDP-mannose 4,6-dehydratase [Leptospiraceae bacterium]|nr:GDP-mannose 4,6-dehydratase [Leptospiraceae bacterium]HNN05153.1 GDP-mannose 4,6-dehydratase [Leptospiraceae bacterium]
MRKAFITGVLGQDGAYLSRLLLEKGYRVFGGARNFSDESVWRLKKLGIENSIEKVLLDMADPKLIDSILEETMPDEIYNLAAQSSVAKSFEDPVGTAVVNALGPLYILEAVRKHCPSGRLFHAGSTEMFGHCPDIKQNEDSAFSPLNPYSSAKVYAYNIMKNYRDIFGLFTVNGILFNHESELRGKQFFTSKVVNHAARYSSGELCILNVGNIDAERDIGFAEDFVKAMFLSLQSDNPDDYIISAGKKYKIREFIEAAYRAAGTEIIWKGSGMEEKGYDSSTGKLIIQVNPANFRPVDVESQWGDPSKIERLLGWKAVTELPEIADRMVKDEIHSLKSEKPF